MSNESQAIESAVSAILASAGVTVSVQARGERKDAFGEKGHTMDAWSVAFTKGNGREAHEEFDYFTGVGHRVDTALTRLARQQLRNVNRNSLAWEREVTMQMKTVAPHVAGVLHSIILDSSASEMSFADWCADSGYETDSRKALATYEACQQSADKLRRLFDRATIEALRDALQDY